MSETVEYFCRVRGMDDELVEMSFAMRDKQKLQPMTSIPFQSVASGLLMLSSQECR
jgi:hypothetical protein